MAEEAIDLFEDAEDGIANEADGAAEDGLDEEEVEEVEREAAEAKENVSKLSKVVDFLKGLEIPQTLLKFTKFIVKNAAVGAIFYGVTVLLKKLTAKDSGSGGGGGESQDAQTKYNKITALSTLIQQLTDTSQALTKWLQDHQDDNITLDGIEVPLIDIFSKYTTAMADAVEKAFAVAKLLVTEKDGKKTFNIPTISQVDTVVTSTEAFVVAFSEFVTFADGKKTQIPALGTLPVSQTDVAKLNIDLQTVKNLPYA